MGQELIFVTLPPALCPRSSVPLSSSQAPILTSQRPRSQRILPPQFWPKLSLTPPLPTPLLFLGQVPGARPSPTSHGLLWDAATHICSPQPCHPVLKAKET